MPAVNALACTTMAALAVKNACACLGASISHARGSYSISCFIPDSMTVISLLRLSCATTPHVHV
jgi:hypothetical protein